VTRSHTAPEPVSRTMDELTGEHWPGLIVFCSAVSWDGVPFAGKNMAKRLAKYAPLLFVDPPVSRLSVVADAAVAGSVSGPRLRAVAPHIARLTPVVPPGVTRFGFRELARVVSRRAVRRAVNLLGGDVRAVVVQHLGDFFGVVPGATEVFYGTDDFVSGASLMGVSERWLRRAEARQLGRADLVVAASPTLVELWSSRSRELAMVPNGCDVRHYELAEFASKPDDIELRGPIAGFFGHLSDRIDLDCLEAVARTGIGLLLVGPRQATFEIGRVGALLRYENVQYLGPKPFDELPRYMGSCDVGLTPYTMSAFNRASNPLKTLEYLATGIPAVATDLPANRLLSPDLVGIASTPESFAQTVLDVLPGAHDPALRKARRTEAARHSWDVRAHEFARLLGLGTTSLPVQESALDADPERAKR
jgi:teichuronic acid biosynthesis glycosyltransferase TuaH